MPPALSSPVKLRNVDVHEQHRHNHRVRQEAVFFHLLGSVAQDEDSPAHHANAAVSPSLDVEVFADTRVELCPCVRAKQVPVLSGPRLSSSKRRETKGRQEWPALLTPVVVIDQAAC